MTNYEILLYRVQIIETPVMSYKTVQKGIVEIEAIRALGNFLPPRQLGVT